MTDSSRNRSALRVTRRTGSLKSLLSFNDKPESFLEKCCRTKHSVQHVILVNGLFNFSDHTFSNQKFISWSLVFDKWNSCPTPMTNSRDYIFIVTWSTTASLPSLVFHEIVVTQNPFHTMNDISFDTRHCEMRVHGFTYLWSRHMSFTPHVI